MSSLEVDPHLRDSVKTQVRHFASDFSALDQAFPGTYPRMIVRAEGAYLFDEDGHRSLDAGVSLGVCQIGHGRAAVANAVSDQIRQLDFVGLEAGFSSQAHFTRAFQRMTGLPPGAYRKLHGRPA